MPTAPTGLRRLLPRGRTLPLHDWQVRHTWLRRLLWLNAAGLLVFALALGVSPGHAATELLPIVVLGLLAHTMRNRWLAATATAMGLLTVSVVLVHLSGGYIEAHFHFFVMIVVLSLYEDWLPFGLAAAVVPAHHALLSVMDPTEVFNHPAGQAMPLLWSGIHAAFVGAAGAAAVVGWRLNEDSRQALRDAFENAVAGMVHLGPDGTVHRVNGAFAQLMQTPREELVGSVCTELVHPDDQAQHTEQMRRTLAGEQAGFSVELRLNRPSGGETLWAVVATSLVRGPGGRPAYFVTQVQDVSEQRNASALLEHQAVHDHLTGLPNRMAMVSRLEALLAAGGRPGVLFLDLDRFKLVNDSLGHVAGDLLLIEVAHRLLAACRDGETVARFGGDEFVVLAEHLADDAAAHELADRLLAGMTGPVEVGRTEVVPALSIGICRATAGSTADALLRDADTAMYAAKARNGGVVLFAESMRSSATLRLDLERDLRAGLADEEFVLFYQSIVSLLDGRPMATEALIRWRRRGELVPPGDFIPLAEDTGFIVPLGEWALREACRCAVRWRRDRGADAALPIHVNVAARQLFDDGFADTVARVLAETGASSADIAVEITETGLIESADLAAATLDELRRLGLRIVLDDFGTGYSSLSHLLRFPIDEIKVDRSFVNRITEDGTERAIVAAILGIAWALNLGVVAEGIEEPEQAEVLAELGCTLGQGYLFGRPAPEEAAPAPTEVAAEVASGAAPDPAPILPAPRGAADERASAPGPLAAAADSGPA